MNTLFSIALVALSVVACDSASERVADCLPYSEPDTWDDGTVAQAMAAQIPDNGRQVSMYAETCTELGCDESVRRPVFVERGMATVLCGVEYTRNGEIVRAAPSYAIFRDGAP